MKPDNRNLSVTWNITKKCLYNCNICATRNNRKELDSKQKLHVLHSIIDTKHYQISELDFAGGDPLTDESSLETILLAKKLLGRDFVSVTTTGRGIRNVEKELLPQLLYKCELSFDISSTENIRKEATYSHDCLSVIREYTGFFTYLTINIPILSTDVSREQIKALADIINQIEVCDLRIVFIRLMPVGLQSLAEMPEHYHPERVIDDLKAFIHPTIPVHLHCVLRGEVNHDISHCGMAQTKIGVDCAGNVFSCAWAGDCDYPHALDTYPFYIGNLLISSLDELLLGEKVRRLSHMANHFGTKCVLLDC